MKIDREKFDIDDKITAENRKYMEEGFSVQKYWTERYYNQGNSGWGSWDSNAVKFKADYVNEVIKKYNINTVCDLGCGDGNMIKYFSGYKQYYGYDIAPVAVSMCKSQYEKDINKIFYYKMEEILDKKYDLSLSLDIIYHLVEDDMYQKYMHDLFSIADIVCIFSTNHGTPVSLDLLHIKDRIFTKDINENFELIDSKEFTSTVGFYLYKKKII